MPATETLPQDQAQSQEFPKEFPPQHQDRQPGIEAEMDPKPLYDDPDYRGSGKLRDKVALITGGDSGIGRAVAIAFAKEGADVAIVYLDEHQDAEETKRLVAEKGRRCIAIAGDVGDEAFCRQAVEQTVRELSKLDILVNNAAQQYLNNGIQEITAEQVEKVFRTNIFGYIFMAKAALPHIPAGGAIVSLHEGRHPHLHPRPGQGSDRERRACQRGRPRPDLDAAHPRLLPRRGHQAIRSGHPDEARRPAQ
jgi:hypothetical protein